MKLIKLSLSLLLIFCPIAHVHGASVAISLAQSTDIALQGGIPVDLTQDGNLDWAVWENSSYVPTDSMNGGAGFVSLAPVGTVNPGANYSGDFNFEWTNGSVTASSSTFNTDQYNPLNNDDGVRLSVNVPVAKTYQLKFYDYTFNLQLRGTATLGGGANDSTAGTLNTIDVENYVWTVDFSTDGPDTLTLDIVKIGGGNIHALGAFTLQIIPEPSSTALLGLGGLALMLRRRR